MREPIRILSLGAGVQSTTLLMLAHAGELEVDAAVFADTGWEPSGVYDHLWQIAERVDIPIIVTWTGCGRRARCSATT